MNRYGFVLALGVCACATSARANLVVNGSFETPFTPVNTTVSVGDSALTGWQISGTSGIDLVGSLWQASDGQQSISLNWVSPSTLTQVIPTTPGTQYTLSFDMAAEIFGGPPVRTMDVLWDGALVESAVFNYTGQGPGAMGWEAHSWTVVGGAGGSDTLEFVSTTPANYGPALDNVTLNEVPGPGTGVLGLLVLARATRRNRA